jgi:hypothetical protein
MPNYSYLILNPKTTKKMHEIPKETLTFPLLALCWCSRTASAYGGKYGNSKVARMLCWAL